jgi:hypothetical protein
VLGRKLGLVRIPALLVSEQAPGPLALGLLRPEIILPRRALESLSPLEQRMALAHELAHVRRRDLWLGWVPALARAVFFFHPLVRRACQEYALAREEACDAAALQATGAEPHDYGRLLLLFGVARAPAAAAASGAPSHLAALKRRIAMLEHAENDAKRHPRWVRWVLGGLALVALVPFQVVAREPPASTPAPGVPGNPGVSGNLAVPHSSPSAPRGAGEDPAFAYVLIASPHHTTMSGSTEDLKAAHALAGGGKQPLLYVRRDGQAYIIRDAATLKAVEESFATQRALGEKQSELGHKQSELGHEQSKLGHKQSELGQKQANIGRKMAEVARKRSNLALERHRLERTNAPVSPEFERREQELERELEPLEQQMEELGRQMEVFTQPMEELGRRMEELGKPMEELGRQMELANQEAEKRVRTLLDDAIRKGVAEPVKR